MSAAPYIDDLLRAVASDVRATLAGELGSQTPEALVDEVFELADSVLRAIGEKTSPRRLPVCQPGCDSCCHLHMVFVSPLEALRLAAHIRETRRPEERASLEARMRAFAERIAEMSVDERAAARVPCPLLDENGACGVHAVRPLLCRGYNSYELEPCLAAFDAGTAKTRLPCNAAQVSVHQTLFAALVVGGAERRDAGPFELVHAVLDALAHEDATARWLRGDEVFSSEAARVSREVEGEWAAFIARSTPRTSSRA